MNWIDWARVATVIIGLYLGMRVGRVGVTQHKLALLLLSPILSVLVVAATYWAILLLAMCDVDPGLRLPGIAQFIVSLPFHAVIGTPLALIGGALGLLISRWRSIRPR